MHTYYLRCIEPDYPTMIALGTTLGVITTNEDGQIMATESGCWDYIGPIYERTGGTDEEPVLTAKTDADGNTYIHVNLRSPINMNEAAAALIAEHPELATGLNDMGRFFVIDTDGQPARPNQPHRVFAGD